MSPATIALTIAVKAAPMTTATARSMTFPRRMNSLKPLIMRCSSLSPASAGHVPDGAGEAFASDFDDAEDAAESPPEEEDEEDEDDEDATGIRRLCRSRRARVGAVEAGAVERHADRAVLLAERAAAFRALGQGGLG